MEWIALSIAVFSLAFTIVSGVLNWRYTDLLFRTAEADKEVIDIARRGGDPSDLLAVYIRYRVPNASDRVAYYWSHYRPKT